MGNRLFVMLTALLAAACWETDVPPPKGDDCAAACSRFRELGCEEGEPTPDGAPCERVCETVNASGAYRLPTECVSEAASCDAARECR